MKAKEVEDLKEPGDVHFYTDELLYFLCPKCGGLGGVKFGPQGWQLISREPLTIGGSILHDKTKCGYHGFIRDGEWVDA